jgi:cytochrome c-type biogenesis protein CcmF
MLAAAASIGAALILSRGLPRPTRRAWRLGRLAVMLSGVACSVACLALLVMLLTRDLASRYVYEHVSTSLSVIYTVSAFWAGQEGSLLFWLWCASLTNAAVAWRPRASAYAPLTALCLALVQAYLVLLLLLHANPFLSLFPPATEGLGLNPLLQNVWMAVHPPLILAAYAAYGVPLGLALAGVLSGKMGASWRQALRRWALLAWLLLSAGILLGARWAYVELSWGGYWGWDPVENASLVPWLTGTALLHTLSAPSDRPNLRTLSLWLAALTFALCFMATFITRSGVVQSVHAFAPSPARWAYAAPTLAAPLALGVAHARRRSQLPHESAEPGWLSRDTSIVITLVLLGNMALATLVGTFLPAISQALRGRSASVGPAFYEQTVGWLGLALIGVLGVCPFLRWGRTPGKLLALRLMLPAFVAVLVGLALIVTGWGPLSAAISLAILAFVAAALGQGAWLDINRAWAGSLREDGISMPEAIWRQRRRHGARLVHLAIVLIALGIICSNIGGSSRRVTLQPGESVEIAGYRLHYRALILDEGATWERVVADLELARGARPRALLAPGRTFYHPRGQWVSQVAIYSRPRGDVYVALEGVAEDQLIGLRVLILPLIGGIWLGGALLLAGGAIAWWPERARRRGSS